MGTESRSQQTLGFYYDTDLWVIDTRTADRHTSDDDQGPDLVTTSSQISVSGHSLILDKSYDKRLLKKKLAIELHKLTFVHSYNNLQQ